MSHSHSTHGDHSNSRRVWIALILTAGFMVVEVIGGLLSGSLALLADAGHMLTDSMALALAIIAFRVGARPADLQRSFGYERFQIIAAFVNGLALVVVVGFIAIEAIGRLFSPVDVAGDTMMVVAVAGLVVNIIAFVVLHGGDQSNLNMRGAALHVLGDLLGSVAAIIAALVIIRTNWTPIDPILSIFVALLILKSAWRLVSHSAHILLEGTPDWLDIENLERVTLADVPDVAAIHHVHVWGLTPQRPMLTMHVVLRDLTVDSSAVVRRVKTLLAKEFQIEHSTIEIEYEECADADTTQHTKDCG